MNSFAGDLRVGVSGADEVEHVPLAPGQPARVFAGRGLRAGRDRSDAQPAHSLPGHPGGCGRAEVVECAKGGAQVVGVGAVQQRQCRVVRTAQVGPGRRGCGRVIADHQAVRRGHLAVHRERRSGAPQPDRDRSPFPHLAAVGEVGGALGLPYRLRVATLQPERLHAGQPHRRDPLGLAAAVGGLLRLVQVSPRGRSLTAASPQDADADQRIEPVDRRGHAPQELRAQRDRLVPPAGLLHHVRTLTGQAGGIGTHVPFVAVGQPLHEERSASAYRRWRL